MDEIRLKYGCNPNQGSARVYVEDKLPIRGLNGRAGYINLLDALNALSFQGCYIPLNFERIRVATSANCSDVGSSFSFPKCMSASFCIGTK